MRIMKKNWSYNGVDYTIERAHGYGQFVLNGFHCTLSSVWDDVDDDCCPEKQEEAMREAEAFLHTKNY